MTRNLDAIKFLIGIGQSMDLETVFEKTMFTINPDQLRLILTTCELRNTDLATILAKAARSNSCEIVGILLQQCPPVGRTFSTSLKSNHPTDEVIVTAMSKAARDGRLDMVKVLAQKCGAFACETLHRAASYNWWGVVDALLETCDEQYLREPRMKRCASAMMEQAAADDGVEMALRLLKKCGEVDTDDALDTTMENGSLSILNLLAEKSSMSCVVYAFVTAAEKKPG